MPCSRSGAGALWTARFFARRPRKPRRPRRAGDHGAGAEREVPIFRSGVGTVGAQAERHGAGARRRAARAGRLHRRPGRQGRTAAGAARPAHLPGAARAGAGAARTRLRAARQRARRPRSATPTCSREEAATQQQVDTQKALVAQLQAAVQTDEAQIHLAQVQLGYTRIVAPMSGRTGARLVDPGNIVHAADANGLVVINKVDPVAVSSPCPRRRSRTSTRRCNAPTTPLQVIAYPRNGENALGSGKLTLLNNQIDTTTGTVQLKGALPEPGHALWPGQYVNVRLVLGRDPHALTVPARRSSAARPASSSGSSATTARRATSRCAVASIQDGLAVMKSGVQAGERVVVDGQYKLRPGSRWRRSPARRARRRPRNRRLRASPSRAPWPISPRRNPRARRTATAPAPTRAPASPAPGAEQRQRGGRPMNISAGFIKRPIGTTLLAARHPAGRHRGVSAAAGGAVAAGRFSDHPGRRPTCPARARRRWPRTSPSRSSASSR